MAIRLWMAAAGILLGAACVLAQPSSVNLYVAVNGNDAWSGKLPEPNADKTDGPFATLQRARDEIRSLKTHTPQSAAPNGVTVFVRHGAYELPDAFKLALEDSGTETAPVVYRAYQKEKVVLIGGRKITGFAPHRGAIMKADVGAQGFKGIYFRQLFYNGRRQHLARYPNFDPQNPYGGGYAYVDGEPVSMYKDLPDDDRRRLRYREKDARTWARPEEGEVNIFPRYNWVNNIIPIGSVDKEKRIIWLAKEVRTPEKPAIRPLDRYYIRNLPEELDSPGEWYLDKQTWTLYFWPPGPIEDGSVTAPVTESVIEIGPNAAWITIRGFTIECCDGSAMVVNKSENCLIAGNTIHDTGGRLDYSTGVSVNGGRRCGVVGNDIFEVCNGGIRLSGGDANTLASAEHYAENNYIHHIGVLNGHGCGIYLSGVGVRASHNLIHDTTRCGVFGGGPDSIVEYNHIRHTNLETEDTGGFYNGGNWYIRGQVIRYNYVHDVLGYGRQKDKWVSPYFCWGIYLDFSKSGTHVYGNIVARTYLGGCHLHAGRDNVIENNIFIENVRQQMQLSGHGPQSIFVIANLKTFEKFWKSPAYAKYPELAKMDPKTAWQMVGNKFRRNIVYYRNPKALLYRQTYWDDNTPEQNEFDYNLIWHFGLPLDLEIAHRAQPPQKTWEAIVKSWEEWQKRGHDTHSVIADPLFVDADKDDYRLKPDSPALKLGFEPIPVEKIGPYESDLRATWPIVEAEGAREMPLVSERQEEP